MKKKHLKKIRAEQARYINHLVEKITSLEAMNGRREWYRNEFRQMADDAISRAKREAQAIAAGCELYDLDAGEPVTPTGVLFMDEITPSEEQIKTMRMATHAMMKEKLRNKWPFINGLMFIPSSVYDPAEFSGVPAEKPDAD